jgi:hypothetical protein
MKFNHSESYKQLQTHFQKLKNKHLRNLFQEDPNRCRELAVKTEHIYYDYSRQRVTSETIKLLFNLAKEKGLAKQIQSMFKGDKINKTENRPVLHVALRAEDKMPEVKAVLDKTEKFSNEVTHQKYCCHWNRRILFGTRIFGNCFKALRKKGNEFGLCRQHRRHRFCRKNSRIGPRRNHGCGCL